MEQEPWQRVTVPVLDPASWLVMHSVLALVFALLLGRRRGGAAALTYAVSVSVWNSTSRREVSAQRPAFSQVSFFFFFGAAAD
jgi:hypothetical protein